MNWKTIILSSIASFLFLSLFLSFTIDGREKNFCSKNSDQNIYDELSNTDTLYVGNPTGEFEKDRELITKVLEKAKAGDIIKFSQGTYYIGKLIKIEIPKLSLIGHKNKTIIRGCQPIGFNEHIEALLNCGGFELVGESQTIRNFTFEYAWHGLMIGCCLPSNMEELESGSNIKLNHPGGHTIENNTFRYNSTGIRVIGINSKMVNISSNVFIDNYHGLTINGSKVTVKNNGFYSKDPAKVPLDKESDNAIGITPFFDGLLPQLMSTDENDCSNITIVNNHIENFKNLIRVNGKNPRDIGIEDDCANITIEKNTVSN